MAGAKDERFKAIPTWSESHEAHAPAGNPDATMILGAYKLFQHFHARPVMSTAAGTEAHPIVDNTLNENGFEAWRHLVHTFDPASAQANFNIMRQILKPAKGTVEITSIQIEMWEKMVPCQDERTSRHALADDTKRATLMDMCRVELETHLAIRDCLDPFRHKTDPMDGGDMAWTENHCAEGKREDVHASGCIREGI